MERRSLEIEGGGETLSLSMRAIRRRRQLTAAVVSQRMGIGLRTYEEFEGGRGLLSVERIFSFADAVDCDPIALILGTMFELPDFALDCIDTKLCLIMVMQLQEFALKETRDIAYLDPPLVIGGLKRLFADLSRTLEDSEKFLQNWLDERVGSIGLKSLRLRGLIRRKPKD